MYAWLWRKLPGPWPVKTLESLVLFVATCALLVVVVFPWVEPKLPFSDNVVDGRPIPASTSEPTESATPDETADEGTDADEQAGDKDDKDDKDKKKKDKNEDEDGSGGSDGDSSGGDTLPGDG